MRILLLAYSLLLSLALPCSPLEMTENRLSQVIAEMPKNMVVAWDVIELQDKQLLFTIEGINDTVFSPHLKSHLKTGTVIKIYQIDAERDYLDNANSVDSKLIRQLQLPCIYQNKMRSAHPWLITVGQSDDDAHIEVFVGAFRATKYYSAETRPYFLEYRDGVIVRRWTGSRLNGIAFSDADYVDHDGDGRDELKVVEHDFRNGKPYSEISYYRLYGFTPHRLNFSR